MGLAFLYMLAYSHSNTKFDFLEETLEDKAMPDWARARLDSPGWVEQHQQFISEINEAREDQVLPERCPPSLRFTSYASP